MSSSSSSLPESNPAESASICVWTHETVVVFVRLVAPTRPFDLNWVDESLLRNVLIARSEALIPFHAQIPVH